ncbi:energy-coupling factor ABC transporter ATP-binding protein [Sulfitobacter pacificus]|uniref:ABC transporter ATP-binding protein n=1 Tax=Sulfitobacter pacificus TaxID=1499314 RepID=A0ABQ5VPQ1_9RHOB|nr:ABC transporter ATP-binding protein [Sulfitobacter pacificus]GLQ29188.1 ABC transporter ATP-binding protein [Sulfitobacter pacificus]
MSSLTFHDVSVVKGEAAILSGISIALSERRVAIIGRNGSGKSTFARLFNGIETPSRGEIHIDGVAGSRTLRRNVGFVFQNPDNQIVYPIVGEDIEFGLKNLKLPPAEREKRIVAILDQLSLHHLRDQMTHKLSGGEKQLIALAGVLVMQPKWIVMDEPTTLLDHWNKNRFMRILNSLRQNVIMVSHDHDLLSGFDRVLHIDNGKLVDDGVPATVIPSYLKRSKC